MLEDRGDYVCVNRFSCYELSACTLPVEICDGSWHCPYVDDENMYDYHQGLSHYYTITHLHGFLCI